MRLLQTESRGAQEAYTVYAGMGVGRSLRKLHDLLIQEWGEERAPAFKTIELWSLSFGWQNRVRAFDAETMERLLAEHQEYVAKEAKRRLRRRGRISDMAMTSVEGTLFRRVEQMTPEEAQQYPQGRILAMSEIDPVVNHNSRLWFQTTSRVEQTDFGPRTERIEHTGADGTPLPAGETNILTQQLVVVTPAAIAEAREQLKELTATLVREQNPEMAGPAPEPLPDHGVGEVLDPQALEYEDVG